jgi:hypothetical protein
MDILDNETLEQIKNIVNIAKNDKTPLQKQKVKKAKKVKEVTLTSTILNAPNSDGEKNVPTPETAPEPLPETAPVAEPKKKRVQSEKQRAAFVILQEKRKEQVEKQKLVKKIEASKLLLENDVKLKIQKVKKPKGTIVDFNNFPEEDSDDDSEEEPEPVKKHPWGTSTRNKKSVKKPPQPIKVVQAKYETPVFF